MAPPPTKRRRVVLTLEKKQEIIEKIEAGWTIPRISRVYDVPSNTLYDLRKNKDKIKEYQLYFGKKTTKNVERKVISVPKHAKINQATLTRSRQQRSAGVLVRGAELKAVAEKFARLHETEDSKTFEGGGPTKATQLSATEEAMTAIISDDAIGGHPEVSDVVEVPEDLMAKEEEYPEDPLMIIEDAYSIPIEMTPGRITGGTASSSPCQEGDAPLDPTSAGQETQDRGTPSPCDRRYPRTYNCRERRSDLHTAFARKKKISPSGLGRKNIKPYYLMDVLQFHPPYLKEHQPTDIQENEPSLEQASEEVNEDSFQEIADEHCEGNVPQENDAIPPTYNKGASVNSAERRKRNNLSAIDQTFVDFINLTKARVNSEDDPRKLFLMSLLPDVHAMTEVQMRKFRKLVLHAVDTVLEEPSNNIHMNFSPS